MDMDIVKLCLDMGAYKAEEIPVQKLVFSPELRMLCEKNACGRFARNYTCPPSVGEVDDLIQKLRSFSKAIIWQNIYKLEDSFDYEGMMEGQRKHSTMTLEIARSVYAELGRENALVLGAGGCTLCDRCAIQTNESCRYPDDALSSLEAYGINVTKIGEVSDLKYINGINTVTYFSGVFLNQPKDFTHRQVAKSPQICL
jgi:predicted metal-binding protein